MECSICDIAIDDSISFHYSDNAEICRCCYCKLSQIANQEFDSKGCRNCTFEEYNKNKFLELYNIADADIAVYRKRLDEIKDKMLFVCPVCFNYVAFDKSLEFEETNGLKGGIKKISFKKKQECPCGYKKKDFLRLERYKKETESIQKECESEIESND